MKNKLKRIQKDSCILDLGTFNLAVSVFNESGLNKPNNTENILCLLELNILFEAICLYDKIYIPFQPREGSNINDVEDSIKAKNEFAKSLFDIGIVSLIGFEEILDNINNYETVKEICDAELPLDDLTSLFMWRMKGLVIHEDKDYSYLIKANERKEKGNKIITKSFIDSDIAYIKMIEEFCTNTKTYYLPGIYNTSLYSGKPDLKRQIYNSLKNTFKEQILGLKDLNYCVPIYIPPITTLVLSRANSNKNIIKEIIDLRSEFIDFRSKYNNYQDAIRNPENLTLKELTEIRKDSFVQVYDALSKVSERKYSNLWFELFTANLNFPSDESLDIKGGLNFLSLIKLANKGIKLNQIEGRASILFDIYTRLGEVKEYHKIYENLFKLNIQEDSVSKISKYSQFVENYISINRKERFIKSPENNV